MCVFLAPLAVAAVAAGGATAAGATALAATTMAMTAAAGTMGAIGAIQQGQNAQASANYQAAVARNNQTIAQQNAEAERGAGTAQEQQQRFAGAEKVSGLRAALAGNGVDIGSGSALSLQGDMAAGNELDALTIRNNSERRAYGYLAQAGNFGAESTLDVAQGKMQRDASYLSAAGSLLGSASQFGSQYASFKTAGLIK